jgi:hypothetical protein
MKCGRVSFDVILLAHLLLCVNLWELCKLKYKFRCCVNLSLDSRHCFVGEWKGEGNVNHRFLSTVYRLQ